MFIFKDTKKYTIQKLELVFHCTRHSTLAHSSVSISGKRVTCIIKYDSI